MQRPAMFDTRVLLAESKSFRNALCICSSLSIDSAIRTKRRAPANASKASAARIASSDARAGLIRSWRLLRVYCFLSSA